MANCYTKSGKSLFWCNWRVETRTTFFPRGSKHRGTLRPAAASGAAARSAMRRSAVDAVAAPLKTWWFTGDWDGIERFLYGEVGKKWSFVVNCVGLMEDTITCVYIYITVVYVCMYVWYGMVWYGMVWYGMVWYGMVWYGMVCMYVCMYVWYCIVLYCIVWYGMVWMYVCMYVCMYILLLLLIIIIINYYYY